MNMLDAIVGAGNGAAVRQLGSQVGLREDQTTAALGALVPMLAAGLQRNARDAGGLESLLGALAGGGHTRYLDDPTTLAREDALADGNGILGHVFGSKQVSREVAGRAAAQTGIGADALKRLLPLAATLVMGALARQTAPATAGIAPVPGPASGGGLMNMLGAAFDQNRDGSVLDDVLNVVKRSLAP
jgi:hypothetical protein